MAFLLPMQLLRAFQRKILMVRFLHSKAVMFISLT